MPALLRLSLASFALVPLFAFGCGNGGKKPLLPDGGDPVADDAGMPPVGRMVTTVIDPGAPPDAPAKFGGTNNPSLAPEIAYPPEGALIPPNMNELEVQFTPKGGADLFEVGFSNDLIDLRIYTKCKTAGAGCGVQPDEATWKALSTAGRGGALTITVRATASNGGPVGAAAPRDLAFTDEDMLGGLYYWAAAAGGIYRYDFGRRGQKAEAFYTPGQAGAMCAGCHALSRSGKRIAVGLNAPTPAPTMRVLDVATRKSLFDLGGGFGGGSNYEALTPDGSKVITTEAAGLTIRDVQTNTVIGANPSLPNANMPDVSPDGARVVFARSQANCQFGLCVTLSTMAAGVYVTSFSGTDFGTPKNIVPGGGSNNYYPSFSPDGQFVVFNRSAGDSYDAKDAKVMVVRSSGGAVVDLGVVNQTQGNSWPKWAPFVHHRNGQVIFWITFSSRRAVGLRDNPNAQLWMVPVDAVKLAGATDPARPPIWLPFQDAATGNHIAQWVEKVERQPCTQIDNAGCMQNEICENGECVPKIQ